MGQLQNRPISLLSRNSLLFVLAILVILGVFLPWAKSPLLLFPNTNSSSSSSSFSLSSVSDWRDYSLAQAAEFVAKNGTVIICAVSYPFLPFLKNWLISVSRQKHQDKVLVIAEDYATLYKVNKKWPGHAVLIPPALDSQIAHNFGSKGFFNFTSRRPQHLFFDNPVSRPHSDPTIHWAEARDQGFLSLHLRAPWNWWSGTLQPASKFCSGQASNPGGGAHSPQHLLQMLELGYNVMYNDVDMVWLQDPFQYLEGSHDTYFTDDRVKIKPLNHSHDLPTPDRNGVTYICSCMIFLRPTYGAKLLMKKWIEELQSSSKSFEGNDQPAFNWALNKTADQVDLYLLPQAAFPTGGLYFKNEAWAEETKGKHVIIHNNYIIGYDNKMKRFHDFGLWLVDDHALESPLGKLE